MKRGILVLGRFPFDVVVPETTGRGSDALQVAVIVRMW